MSKWTKGPWSVGYGNGLCGDVISWQCYLDDYDCHSLPIAAGDKAIAVINYSFGRDDSQHKANARLIAQAPVLAKRLASLIDELEDEVITLGRGEGISIDKYCNTWHDAKQALQDAGWYDE